MATIFEPGSLGSLTIENRLIHSATYECMAGEDGAVTQELIQRYRTLAKGQVGLVIPGYLYTMARGRCVPRQTGIHHDGLVPGLRQLVETVHQQGGKIVLQLAHGGRQAPAKLIGGRPLAPSAFGRDPVSLDKPAEASSREIGEIIGSFAQAARRAREAGADGVQIHAAHGYLVNQFLSPFFNRRRDEWGGSDENRFRLLREIIRAVRAEVGADFPVLVKLNTDDHTPRPGITPPLAARYAAWLEGLGVAGLEISSGTYYSFHTSRGQLPMRELLGALPFWMRPLAKVVFKKQVEPCRFAPVYHLPAAKVIKPVLGRTALILVGGVRRKEEMEGILGPGEADFLSMSRPFIRQPFLAQMLKEGRAEAASCVSCNMCLAAIFNNMPLRCYKDGLARR